VASVAAPSNRSDRLAVLVLGVGGNVSQGILKALSLSQLDLRVIAACVGPLSSGLYLGAETALISPLAADDRFVPWLLETCREHGVGAVLSGVEPVLEALAAHRGEIEAAGAVPVVAPADALAIGADKLRTAEWLSEQGLNAPSSASAADAGALAALVERAGLPLIAKPRLGKGSQGVIAVADERDLEWVRGREEYVVQELLGDAGSEYTVGCFCDREGELRGTVAFHRTLAGGTTVSARAGSFPEVTAAAARIAAALAAPGPLNVQLRVHEGRPTCFELNVRFSGTTPIRARLGFNEVDAALRHLVLGKPVAELPRVQSGTALRYWNEVYVADDAVGELGRSGRLDQPAQDARVENLGGDR
jgi:carbamoyl-phosphate synthase large subunit